MAIFSLCDPAIAQAAPPAPYNPGAMTPIQAAAYIELAPPSVVIRASADSTVARIFSEPSVRKFFAPLLNDIEGKKKAVSDSIGMKIDDALALINTPIVVCYLHHPLQKSFKPGYNVVVFARCSDPAAVRSILGRLHSSRDKSPQILNYAGCAYWKTPSQRNSPVFGIIKNTVIWAGSEKALKTFLDTGLGKGPSLAEEPAFKRLLEKTPRPKAGYLFYANVERLMAAMNTPEEPMKTRVEHLAKVLGGYDLKSVLLVGKPCSDGGIHDTLILHAPKLKSGLLDLSGKAVIDDDKLTIIPKDANSFSAMSFNFPRIHDLVFEILGSLGMARQNKAQEQLAEFEKKGGFSVREELAKTFGSRLVIYSRFANDAGLLSSLAGQAEKVLAIEIQDAKRADTLVNRLLAINPDIIRRKFNNEYRGVKISKVLFSSLRLPLEINYAIAGNYLLVSNELAAIMHVIDSLNAKGQKSILDNEMFRACAGKLTVKGEKVAVFYTDVRKNFEFLYSILRTVLKLATLNRKFDMAPVDLASVPPVGDIAKHLFGASFAIYRTDDGLVLEHYSPIGGANVLMGLTAVGASFFFPYDAQSKPSMKDKCRDNLKQIHKALGKYAQSHNGLTPIPTEADIKELAKKLKEDRPDVLKGIAAMNMLLNEKGISLTEKTVSCPYQSDHTHPGYLVATGIPIKGFDTPREIILAYDHPDNHADLTRNVLFADGTVRTISELDFQKLMVKQSIGKKE